MLWADSDPVIPLSVGERFAESIGREAPRVIEDAGHFLQEDQGPLIGRLIADWLVSCVAPDPAAYSAGARGDLDRLGSGLGGRRETRLETGLRA